MKRIEPHCGFDKTRLCDDRCKWYVPEGLESDQAIDCVLIELLAEIAAGLEVDFGGVK